MLGQPGHRDRVVTLTRRRALQAGATSGALALWPTAVLLDRHPDQPPEPLAATLVGTTLEATLTTARDTRTSLSSTLRKAPGDGYRRLRSGPGESLVVRDELARPRRGRAERRTGLGTLVQVSDLHITDAQHPMRFEYLNRINGIGHRPQEMLGVHGTIALVKRINAITGGPWTGRSVDLVMSTGDNTDNQSRNELEWLLGTLAGGVVRPDSGSTQGYDGVAASGHREFWNPASRASDAFKRRGFPHVPGLLRAATRPVRSPGLQVPWILTMGNHDDAVGGMVANRGYLDDWATGNRKIFSAHSDHALRLARVLAVPEPGDNVAALLATLARTGQTRRVAADPLRARATGAEYLRMLRDPRFEGAGPVGHGYDADADPARLYFSYPATDRVTVISLDSTNQAGGSHGSIGAGQLRWLEAELRAHTDRYVVVLSHHPCSGMDNLAPDPRARHERRHSGRAVAQALHRHPNVLAWVNGHTHRNRITPHRHDDPRRSFWEINSASHVDAPQQARLIEVANNGDGTVSLLTTMLDADAPLVPSPDDLSTAGLASYYRELAFNDAHKDRSGRRSDRNTELLLVDPLPQ